MAFLLECLEDLDTQFWYHGGKLNLVEGDPVEVLRKISKHYAISKLCFDQDCEPIWLERDNAVKNFCGTHKIQIEESIGATLWDPLEIIEANGGSPPLTYSQFCHVTKGIGQPKKPVPDVELKGVQFVELDNCENILSEMTMFPNIPTPQMLGIEKEEDVDKIYKGGERGALKYLYRRIEHEQQSFLEGAFLPNRREPNILNPPKSLSPDLKFGYWAVRWMPGTKSMMTIHLGHTPSSHNSFGGNSSMPCQQTILSTEKWRGIRSVSMFLGITMKTI